MRVGLQRGKRGVGWKVPGFGRLDAPILVLGEAPGEQEERTGEPFVGPAGQLQDRCWEQVGLRRGKDVRIENVVEVRPPGNSLLKLTPQRIATWQSHCWKRIVACRPKLIVPTGNLALNTLMRTPLPVTLRGQWRVREGIIQWPQKIGNWRGHLGWVEEGGRRLPMLPVAHPASLFRNHYGVPVWEEDWQRIAEAKEEIERTGRLVEIPTCTHKVAPTLAECYQFLRQVEAAWKRDPKRFVLAFDIETPGGPIACIGFSFDERASLTISLIPAAWPGGTSDLPSAWGVVRRLLTGPWSKGTHGGTFDRYVLARSGVVPTKVDWDSKDLHHILDPSDQHSLAYVASRMLRVPYWKDEAKEGDGRYGKQWTRDWRGLARYCGMDACYTRALIERGRERVEAAGLRSTYVRHYRAVSKAAVELSLAGLPVDRVQRAAMVKEEERHLTEIATDLHALVGESLVAKKGLSGPKILWLYFGALVARPPKKTAIVPFNCKPKRGRGLKHSGKLTADELSIRRMMLAYPKTAAVGKLILEYRRRQKKREFLSGALDGDGRFRSQYKLTPMTGRFASSKTPEGTGGNGQNQDRETRGIFRAGKGKAFLQLDYSQAESRIVDGQCGTKLGWELARSNPAEVDLHSVNADAIFKPGEVPQQRRDIGKRTRHAVNYKMGGARMAEMVLIQTEGAIVYAAEECEEWIASMLSARPDISRWHEWVRRQVVETGRVETSWGIPLRFPWRHFRLTEEDIKQACAYGPQSEVGRLLNQCGLVPARKIIRREGWTRRECQIVNQSHDSLMVEGAPEALVELAEELVPIMEQEREYGGLGGAWTLKMPVGVAVGTRWGKGMKEWKRMPKRGELREVVEEVVRREDR